MASPVYTVINASEVDADSPLTASLAFRWTYNPISIMQGSPTARAAGLGVWIAKSPGGVDPAQTAILTDAVDPSLRLAPDGAGSVAWSSTIQASGNLESSGSTSGLLNCTAPSQSAASGHAVVGGKNLTQGVAIPRIFLAFSFRFSDSFSAETGKTYIITLNRLRGSTTTAIHTETIVFVGLGEGGGTTEVHDFLVASQIMLSDAQNGDAYFVDIDATPTITWGRLSLTSV